MANEPCTCDFRQKLEVIADITQNIYYNGCPLSLKITILTVYLFNSNHHMKYDNLWIRTTSVKCLSTDLV